VQKTSAHSAHCLSEPRAASSGSRLPQWEHGAWAAVGPSRALLAGAAEATAAVRVDCSRAAAMSRAMASAAAGQGTRDRGVPVHKHKQVCSRETARLVTAPHRLCRRTSLLLRRRPQPLLVVLSCREVQRIVPALAHGLGGQLWLPCKPVVARRVRFLTRCLTAFLGPATSPDLHALLQHSLRHSHGLPPAGPAGNEALECGLRRCRCAWRELLHRPCCSCTGAGCLLCPVPSSLAFLRMG
jgi:hypothetical protein